jgi:membrane associated rhomboid family serine protease
MVLPLYDSNPLRHIGFAYVMAAIIAVCVVAFVFQMSLSHDEGELFIFTYGAIPADIFGLAERPAEIAALPSLLTVFTSMFLHGGFMHILGNMLFLWVLGDNVEDAMGHGRFIVFYLLCGVAAAFAHAIVEPSSTIPMIGASGAISGVIGAYLMLHPHATIRTLVLRFIVPLPAWVVLGLWIGMQVFYAYISPPGEAGVAWWAHIGGFVAGVILIVPFRWRDVPLFDSGESHPVITRTIIPPSGRRPPVRP